MTADNNPYDTRRMISDGYGDDDSIALVELWYPRIERIKTIQVGLIDVRAADHIRISYDFDRDGWVIQQQSGISDDDEEVWQEVAFIESWKLYNPIKEAAEGK